MIKLGSNFATLEHPRVVSLNLVESYFGMD